MFIKKFKNTERFNSEVYNYSVFSAAGFVLPRRMSVDLYELEIVYEQLSGKPADLRHIDYIANAIFRIQESSLPHYGSFVSEESLRNKYLNDVKEALSYFHIDRFIAYDLLSNVFFVSVFKDSKPENWIVNASGDIFMIDFDYVVLSSPWQDMAQFLVGIWLNDHLSISIDSIFYGFDRLFCYEPWKSRLNLIGQGKYMLYSVSCLLSLYKRIKYTNIDYAVCRYFAQQCELKGYI